MCRVRRSERKNGWCLLSTVWIKPHQASWFLQRQNRLKRDLQEQFAERLVHRHYVALVEGIAQSGQADHQLVEDKNLRVFVSEKKTRTSKRAITTWDVLARGENETLLNVVIETGRRTKIQLALAESGTPVVGDKMHGASTNLHGAFVYTQ